jgi:uncharacterized membrane protein
MSDGPTPDIPEESPEPGEFWSLIEEVTRQREAKLCFILPLALFVVALVLGRILAPDFAAEPVTKYSSFFSTAAQVTVAVLIALALDLRQMPFDDMNTRRLITGFTFTYVAVGAAAACFALLPDLSPAAYAWLFALTIAAGSAALVSVVTISYQVVKNEAAGRRREAERHP